MVDNWEWTFQGADQQTAQDQNPKNIIYNIPGEFDVTLKVTGNIQSEMLNKKGVVIVAVPTNIDESVDRSVKIMPNPAVSKLSVSGLKSQGFSYLIIDLHGRLVKSGRTNNNDIDIRDLPIGVYTMIVNGESANEHRLRFVRR